MTETMLDKAAMALVNDIRVRVHGLEPVVSLDHLSEMNHWRDQARAALLAIREANAETIAAGMKAEAPGQGTMESVLEYDNRGADSLSASFTAMIDDILDGKA